MPLEYIPAYVYVDTYNVVVRMCVYKCDHPTYGLVVDRMNMDLKGGIGLGPPSPPLSSSSSSLSSFGGRGSVLAFLLTRSKMVGKKEDEKFAIHEN